MCGIVGYIGNKKVTDVLITGLKKLEYRGYDSSGVALSNEKELNIIKSVGKVKSLEDKINNIKKEYKYGIAHTRWATHGDVNERNCHPQKNGKVTLVHNGIIENYAELKKILIKKKYKFNSETDTEVICALIDYYLKSNSILESINLVINDLKGSYALLIMIDNSNKLYALRKDSPLIIGVGDKENFVASDILAINEYTKEYYDINEKEICVIDQNKIEFYLNNKKIKKDTKMSNWNTESNNTGKYKHFMLKEINEQGYLIDKLLSIYTKNNIILNSIIDLSKYKKIDVVACGSAYHSGLIFKYFIEKYIVDGSIIVNCEVASEYRYKNHYYNSKTLVILVSQSGETADTIACLRMAKDNGVDTLAIVNVESSTIAKESKYKIDMLAGQEIAVATTKGYFTQTMIFILLIIKLCNKKHIFSDTKSKEIISTLRKIGKNINSIIDNPIYNKIAKQIYKEKDIYFIGRSIDYIVLLEASLKLKEISYIHSDNYQAGELKHGPIALIESNTPLISLITDDNIKDKTISNVIEAKSRGAKIYLFTKKKYNIDSKIYDEMVYLNETEDLINPLVSIIPFQLVSYYVALYKDCDIDKPKNLAKSVTVE